jgi:steroid delta-isomerase-like uncharacterized protein
MATHEIKSILTQMQADICLGNLDAVYRYIADGYVFHRAPLPDVVGKEANRKGDEAMLSAFTNNRMTVHEIAVEGNTAAMHYTWQADHTGPSPALGIPASGKTVKLSGCMLYHWKDGKIIEQWDYTDMLGLMQQLGLVPAAA